jgi:hypothetical protein
LLLPTAKDTPDSIGYAFNPDTLRGLLVTQNKENSKLNTLILLHKEAKYADMVNILDEIDVIERSWNEFTARQKGIKADKLAKEDKFSYRYAIGDWEPRDDKIIQEAEAQAELRGQL